MKNSSSSNKEEKRERASIESNNYIEANAHLVAKDVRKKVSLSESLPTPIMELLGMPQDRMLALQHLHY